MRERLVRTWRRLVAIDGPDLTPATWTVAVFLGVVLGDIVRSRAERSPVPAADADLLGVLVCIGFVAFVAIGSVVADRLRDRR